MERTDASAPAGSNRYPPGIPYIIGNEAAERFSYYGMRAILVIYMTALYLHFVPKESAPPDIVEAAETRALQVAHYFFAAVYAFPMVGAIIADRLLGKYLIILWVSVLYCGGHATLAVAGHTEWGMYVGLALIAMGSGGIKPCVSANVGDQFTSANAHLIRGIYQVFYFSVNFGSFFATLLTPILYYKLGPAVAFGVPGILMGLATLIFWMGRNAFVKAPPKPGGRLGLLDAAASLSLFLAFAVLVFFPGEAFALFGIESVFRGRLALCAAFLTVWLLLFGARQRIEPDPGFMGIVAYSLANRNLRRPGMRFFDVARERFGDDAAEGPPAVLKIMLVFSMVSVFWTLFDQHSSTWIHQAESMDLAFTVPYFKKVTLTAAQIPALNPLFVMLIIPFMNFCVYRPLERRGIAFTPLRRMAVGMFLTSASFVAAAVLESRITAAAEEDVKVHVAWQVIPYLLLTASEVMVSVTGLEFAYTQAPRSMKSTIMGFWLLCVTFGNLLTALVAPLQELSLEHLFWVCAGLMAGAAAIFSLMAYFYRGKTYLQESAAR
jgi:POT family proton-dependent oligopeptide transporter